MSATNMSFDTDDFVNDIINLVGNEEDSKDFITSKDNQNSQDEFMGNSQNSDYDSELDEYENMENDQIDKLLEKPLDMITNEKEDVNYYTYDKLQIKGVYWRGCQGTMLPEGWVQVTHACGMPLYLHRESRVCVLSRPYFIGQSSARKHDIPVSAIPCLAYKKRKEAVEKQIREHNLAKYTNFQANSKQSDVNKTTSEPTSANNNQNNNESCPYSNAAATTTTTNNNGNSNSNNKIQNSNQKVSVTIQSNEEKEKESLLPPDRVTEYCKRLFEFDVVKVKKFKTWNDRKKFIKKSKQKKFPENAQMLKIQTKTAKGIQKELSINITNKTPLSILYEYSCRVFKTNPTFEIKEKENPKDPFQAICYINSEICGKGSGNSKKAAKNNAAEEALKVLIPQYQTQVSDTKKNNDDMCTFFDGFPVEHSHIYNLSQSVGAPLPYDVLLTCLKYNYAMNVSRNRKQFIEEEIKPIKFRNCLYRMKLGQYDVEVNCTRKKEGRQLAAQKILKLMHPHVQTWGAILRLYGTKVTDNYLKDEPKVNNENNTSKQDDNANKQQIQQKAKPNKELLEKLKEEMRKIQKRNTTTIVQLDLHKNMSQDSLLTIPPLLMSNEPENKQNELNNSTHENIMNNLQPTTSTSETIKFNDDEFCADTNMNNFQSFGGDTGDTKKSNFKVYLNDEDDEDDDDSDDSDDSDTQSDVSMDEDDDDDDDD